MKWLGDIVGIILTLIGIFWILQGTGIVPIGAMARQGQWAIIGLGLGIVGVGLLVYIHRRPGSSPRATG
jgi:hypothetical protein